MALLFHVRGTALNAYHAEDLGTCYIKRGASASDPVANAVDAGTNVINGRVITKSDASNVRALMYMGRRNWSGNVAMSVVMRIVPRWTGTPAAQNGLCVIGKPGSSATAVGSGLGLSISTAGKIVVATQRDDETALVTATTTAVASFTSGTATEIAVSWDGSVSAGSFKVYQNGALLDSLTPAAALLSRNNLLSFVMLFGQSHNGAVGQFDINEVAIYDTALDASAISALWSRSDWISSTALDGGAYSDPGVANVRSGTAYTYLGLAKTGTAAIPVASNVKIGVSTDATVGTYDGSDRWTDPGVAAVETGTAYKANSTTNNRTGTYDGSNRWTDPGVANVRSGVSYKAGSTTNNRAGTVVVPSLANTKVGVPGDGGTGTYDGSDRWSDPGVHNVATGIAYRADNADVVGDSDEPAESDVRVGVVYDNSTKTGTYDGSDLWSDPGEANVRKDTTYNANGEEMVGTLQVPLSIFSTPSLLDNSGAMPDMSDAIRGLMQHVTFRVITKSVTDFQSDSFETDVVTLASVQTLTAQQLSMKPEGQRAWRWRAIHALPELVLKVDDKIVYHSIIYRVMSKTDWQEYGYVEYHVVEDYTA